MNVLQIVIIVFLVLELLNVLVLYTRPGMKEGNGIGIFKAYADVEKDENVYLLVKYLTTWIANAKVIFIALGITVVIFGDETTQFHAALAFIFSIFMFYFTLYPILKKLDDEGKLTQRGYSKTLAWTILSFILTFIAGIIYYLIA